MTGRATGSAMRGAGLRARLPRAMRVACAAACACAGVAAIAADADVARFPRQVITLVTAAPPGGGIDLAARAIGQRLEQVLPGTVVIEPRVGADSRVANGVVAAAQPDGHTLLVTTTTTTIDIVFNPSVRPNVLQDLVPVTPIARTDVVLVVGSTQPVDSVASLVAYARAHPGVLNFATPGPRSSLRLVGELFKLHAGVDIVHVPYKDASQQATALLVGEVQMAFASLPGMLPYIKAGRMRALGVAGPHRSPFLPEVPTMKEAGFGGVEGFVWYGMFARAATPSALVERIADAVREGASSAAYRRTLEASGAEPFVLAPRAFRALVEADVAKWASIIRDARVAVER